jgi:hypothetical protein
MRDDVTYHFDNSKVSHRNLVYSDQKNIHSEADQNIVASARDRPIMYLEIGLTFSTASRTLNH